MWRPVLVLNRDPKGRLLPSVIRAPITSTAPGQATEVAIGKEAGLVHDWVANVDNTFLLPQRRLVRRFGRARASSMALAAGCR